MISTNTSKELVLCQIKVGLWKVDSISPIILHWSQNSYKDCLKLYIQQLKLKMDSSHCILAYDGALNSIYIDSRRSFENIELFAPVKCSFTDI